MPRPVTKPSSLESVRLDKWLWAARFFKTRRLAQAAVTGGKVSVNGSRAKPAREIHCDDTVTIQSGPYRHEVQVLALSDRRRSATEARELYIESEHSVAERERLRLLLRSQAQQVLYDPGKPAGRARRNLRRLKRGEPAPKSGRSTDD